MALRRVFTYLGAIFLMSYIIFCDNAGAVTTTYSLNGYSVIDSVNSVKMNCQIMDMSNNVISTISNGWNCAGNASTKPLKMHYLSSYDTFSFEKDDIFEFDLLIWSPVSLSSLDGFIPANMYTPSSALILLEFSQPINNVFYNNPISVTNGTGGTLAEGSVYATMYHFVFKARNGTGLKIGFPYNSDNFYWSGDNLTFRMINYNHYRLTGEGSVDQQNEINATNDSVQQSETEGASSQSDAQTGTSSLVSTIGSAVSAITSASPTNCLLNGNMGNFDMGQIDLCANPVPAFVQIISSLILILITVPLCIVMFNRFIGLFRSFQG